MARYVYSLLKTQQRFHLDLRSLENTNRKSYLASQTQLQTCCFDDRKCPKSLARFEFGPRRFNGMAAIIRPHSAIVISRNYCVEPKFAQDQVLIVGCGPGRSQLSAISLSRDATTTATTKPHLHGRHKLRPTVYNTAVLIDESGLQTVGDTLDYHGDV